MLIPKLAMRNLGRNVRRTIVTGLALALGAALSIAYYGLSDGMNVQLVHSLTRYDLGYLQVHAQGWVQRHDLTGTIPDAERVLARVRADPLVTAAAPRVYAAALAAAGAHSSGVILVGVDPAAEARVTELDRRLVEGRFLAFAPTPWPRPRPLSDLEQALDARLTRDETEAAEDEIDALETRPSTAAAAASAATPNRAAPDGAARSRGTAPAESLPVADARAARDLALAVSPRPSRPPDVVLGRSLARVLGLRVGDALYLSTESADGAAEGVRATVRGIFETGTTTYDRSRVYLHYVDLERLVHLDSGIHEIAALTRSPDDAPEAAHRLDHELSGRLDVRAWSELRPDMVRMLDLNRAGSSLLAVIVFVVASLGVVNTMLMAVLERTRELGVLKAIGMSAGRIFAMVVAEAVLLSIGGAIVGVVVGIGLDLFLVEHGIDLRLLTSGISFAGVGMDPVVRGAITVSGVLEPVVVLAVVCVVAAIYPAARAARLPPAIGMRET